MQGGSAAQCEAGAYAAMYSLTPTFLSDGEIRARLLHRHHAPATVFAAHAVRGSVPAGRMAAAFAAAGCPLSVLELRRQLSRFPSAATPGGFDFAAFLTSTGVGGASGSSVQPSARAAPPPPPPAPAPRCLMFESDCAVIAPASLPPDQFRLASPNASVRGLGTLADPRLQQHGISGEAEGIVNPRRHADSAAHATAFRTSTAVARCLDLSPPGGDGADGGGAAAAAAALVEDVVGADVELRRIRPVPVAHVSLLQPPYAVTRGGAGGSDSHIGTAAAWAEEGKRHGPLQYAGDSGASACADEPVGSPSAPQPLHLRVSAGDDGAAAGRAHVPVTPRVAERTAYNPGPSDSTPAAGKPYPDRMGSPLPTSRSPADDHPDADSLRPLDGAVGAAADRHARTVSVGQTTSGPVGATRRQPSPMRRSGDANPVLLASPGARGKGGDDVSGYAARHAAAVAAGSGLEAVAAAVRRNVSHDPAVAARAFAAFLRRGEGGAASDGKLTLTSLLARLRVVSPHITWEQVRQVADAAAAGDPDSDVSCVSVDAVVALLVPPAAPAATVRVGASPRSGQHAVSAAATPRPEPAVAGTAWQPERIDWNSDLMRAATAGAAGGSGDGTSTSFLLTYQRKRLASAAPPPYHGATALAGTGGRHRWEPRSASERASWVARPTDFATFRATWEQRWGAPAAREMAADEAAGSAGPGWSRSVRAPFKVVHLVGGAPLPPAARSE